MHRLRLASGQWSSGARLFKNSIFVYSPLSRAATMSIPYEWDGTLNKSWRGIKGFNYARTTIASDSLDGVFQARGPRNGTGNEKKKRVSVFFGLGESEKRGRGFFRARYTSSHFIEITCFVSGTYDCIWLDVLACVELKTPLTVR